MRKIPVQEFNLKPFEYYETTINLVDGSQIDINLHNIVEKTSKNLRKERLELEKAIKYHSGKEKDKNREF
jgi:hypothetical protein